jgi:putative oxidoreductase
MNAVIPYASIIGRILIAAIFVISGFGKITGYEGTQGYMESMGVPGATLPLVIMLEIAGGLAIVVGWQTRIVALLLAGFTLVSGIVFHSGFGDQMQMISFMKNLAITGGFLFLVANGPGAFAVDNRGKS